MVDDYNTTRKYDSAGHIPLERLWMQQGAHSRVSCLAVSEQGFAVVLLPSGSHGRSQLIGTVTLHSQASVGFACRCETAQLPVFVDWVHNPIDASILYSNSVSAAKVIGFS